MKMFFKPLIAAVLTGAFWTGAHAAGLSPLEMRWMTGMWPVIQQAREMGMPVDPVVQPQDAPDAAPLALGFVNGRCKLVLSLRANPEGEAALDRIPQGLEAGALELMAAHELGHCRRYLEGAWFNLPAGFSAARVPDGLSKDLEQAYLSMKSTRREEGYGDLVALAWTQQRRPAQYAALHDWLMQERTRDLLPGSHHDTLAWLLLAKDPKALGHAPALAAVFDSAKPVWERGLASEE
ncbi:MAG: hypothetical protein ABW220_01320 [Burkholderiaceae bacterium]